MATTITYTGVDGGSFLNFLIGPAPGVKVTAASIGLGLQGAANNFKWGNDHYVNGVDGGTYDGPLVFTDLTIGDDGTITINGASGHVAQSIHGQYSTDTFLSGAGFSCNSGSIFTLGSGAFVTVTIGGGGNAGSLTFGADGTLTIPTTCTTTIALGADGTLSTAIGSAVNLVIGKTTAGTVTNGALAVEVHESSSSDTYNAGSSLVLNGSITRGGSVTLSGAGAYTYQRITTGADADTTYDARAQELIDAAITAPRTYTLTALSAGQNASVKIRNQTSFKLTIKQGATTLYEIDPGGGFNQTVEFFWSTSASSFRLGIVGALAPN